MKSGRDILGPFAYDLTKRITEKSISFFQDSSQTISADDSGLENIWEEICVQVQSEHSFYWNAYDEIVRSRITGYVNVLKGHEKLALWYLTDGYCNWKPTSEDEKPPVYDGDIIGYIIRDFYKEAGNFTSDAIEAFIGGYDLDDEEDYDDEEDEDYEEGHLDSVK